MDNLIPRIQAALQKMGKDMQSNSSIEEEYQITRHQMVLLFMIYKLGPCKLTQLAEKMEVKPSAITVMIDRLENPRYVKRVQDIEDRRAVLVEVTPLGKEVLDKAIRERNKLMKTYLKRLDEQEVVLFTELLEKMMDSDRSQHE